MVGWDPWELAIMDVSSSVDASLGLVDEGCMCE